MNFPCPHTAVRLSAGFTLAEVLVALAILGGGLFVLIGAHQSALQLHMYTQEEVDVRMLMENAVGRAEMGVAGEELSGQGDFGPRYPGFRWSYEAEPRGDTEAPFMLDTEFFSVTATLHVPEGTSRSLTFYTFNNPEMQSIQTGP